MLDDTLLNNQLALRCPRTQSQMVDRRNWDRINIVLYKRYGH